MVTKSPNQQDLAARLQKIDRRLQALGITTGKPLPGQTVGLPPRPRVTVATEARRFARWAEGCNAAKTLLDPLPGPLETLHVLMDGSFSGWQVCAALLELTGPWRSLCVATLSFNVQNTHALIADLDGGRIERVLFAASEYFAGTDPAIYGSLARQLQERGHRIFTGRIHAKILAAETKDGRFYTVESSANLRSCQSVEQFCLSQSEPLFRFHAGWLEEAFRRTTNTTYEQNTRR